MTPQQILDAEDLIAVGVAGDDVRRQMHGTTTTFVRVLEIHVDAPPQALPSGTRAGELRIVGAPGSLDIAVAAVRAATALADGVPVTGFSVTDLLWSGRWRKSRPRSPAPVLPRSRTCPSMQWRTPSRRHSRSTRPG